jgi:hypothetical protein
VRGARVVDGLRSVGQRQPPFDLDKFPHPRPLDINPRHSWVPDCKRRRIDLRSLIADVVVSPWAEADAVEEIELWLKAKRFAASSTPSAMRGDHPPMRICRSRDLLISTASSLALSRDCSCSKSRHNPDSML